MSVNAGTIFRSRWVERPAGVEELDPVALPQGFRAAGVACGIKRSGRPDVGILACDGPARSSAALFTRNAVVSAAVTVSRRADPHRLCGVVANSGNANVSDGERGLRTAEAMAQATAAGLGADPGLIGVASTGVIGVNLPRERVLAGIDGALGALSSDGGEAFSEAIMTTDKWPKRGALEVALPGGPVRLCAQAKGAGMIAPGFATMLCFVETDAQVAGATLERMLRSACSGSFERTTVDGQTSTNDSVFMLASGAAGIAVEGAEAEGALARALDALLRQLAIEMVADGEGARRAARLVVRAPAGRAERVARSVADSPLVRCAVHGGDPNWGRMVAAAGQVLPAESDPRIDVWVGDVQMASASEVVDLGPAEVARAEEAMRADEVDLRLVLDGGGEEAELFLSDLGHDYVSLNSEYST
jgi:glutamate N-acetyltransferase/amino-acid N-acetyltransferase